MQDVIVGILAIAIGAMFCFAGYFAMRIVIPIWGAFAGFVFGAGLIASITDHGFLSTLLGWLVGFGFALLFGIIAYLYYAVSVLIAMAAIGYTLGAGLMVALDVSWSWVIILAGVLMGTLLAVIAIVADMPSLLLAFLTAMSGAIAMTAGVMLLFGAADTEDFSADALVERTDDQWWWYVIIAVLATAGLISQLSKIATVRGTMREAWNEPVGRSTSA